MAKKKILIVDDEVDLIKTVSFRLEAAGYEIISAYDGQQALELARSQNPDLIILDLMLPKMDGYKVCGLLKADSRYSSIPIMMFTVRAQEDDKRLGEEVGVDDYVTKPFEPETLLLKIEALLK